MTRQPKRSSNNNNKNSKNNYRNYNKKLQRNIATNTGYQRRL